MAGAQVGVVDADGHVVETAEDLAGFGWTGTSGNPGLDQVRSASDVGYRLDLARGAREPAQRLADMDREGIEVAVNYPTLLLMANQDAKTIGLSGITFVEVPSGPQQVNALETGLVNIESALLGNDVPALRSLGSVRVSSSFVDGGHYFVPICEASGPLARAADLAPDCPQLKSSWQQMQQFVVTNALSISVDFSPTITAAGQKVHNVGALPGYINGVLNYWGISVS